MAGAAGIGQAFGGGLQSGIGSGMDYHFAQQKEKKEEKRKEAAARYKQNMKHVVNFAKVLQYNEEDIRQGLDSKETKQRRTRQLTMMLQDLSAGEPLSEILKSFIGITVDLNATQTKQLVQSAVSSAGEGAFNMVDLVNASKSDVPGNFKNYVDRFLGREERKARAGLDIARTRESEAKTRGMEQKQRLLKRYTDSLTGQANGKGPGKNLGGLGQGQDTGQGQGRVLSPREALAIGAPGESNALARLSQLEVSKQNLEQRKLVDSPEHRALVTTATEEAKLEVKSRNYRTKPLPYRDLHWLGLKGRQLTKPTSREDLAGLKTPRFIPDEKTVTRLKGHEAAIKNANKLAANIIRKIDGKPQVVGAGRAISAGILSLQRNAVGILSLVPGTESFVEDLKSRIAMNSVLNTIKGPAIEGAEVRSAIVDLTFKVGALMKQIGRGFSDRDYINVSRQIGAATNNDQAMKGVLRSLMLLHNEAFNTEFEVETGGRKFVGLPDADAEYPFKDLSAKALSSVLTPLLSDDLLDQLEAEIQSRLTP